MTDAKYKQNSSVHAKLAQSDFTSTATLQSFGCHPLHIREEQTRFGRQFREILGSCRFPFSLQPTHILTSPVIMQDLGLIADTVFWSKTVIECMASQLPRQMWWKARPDGDHSDSLSSAEQQQDWKQLVQQIPRRCDFWYTDMQLQLYAKRQQKNVLLMQTSQEDSQGLYIYMAPANRLQCLAMMFPPFLPAETFVSDPMPSLVHQMLWNLDPVRAGKLCAVYAPDQLQLVANRRRAFVVAAGGTITGLPGRLTEPDSYLTSPSHPQPSRHIDGTPGFITLLHTLVYAEASSKLRECPREFLCALDGIVHTVVYRLLNTDAASDSKSQYSSSRQGAIFPSVLPKTLANAAFQQLYTELQARYDAVTSHVAASVRLLQDVLLERTELDEAMPVIKQALVHAQLAYKYHEHPSFVGVGVKLQLRGYEVISVDAAYELLLRRLYIAQAEQLYQLLNQRQNNADNNMETGENKGRQQQQLGNQADDLVCLSIPDGHAADLHDSITMTCGEDAFLLGASWFDASCPESASRALLVVRAATLWRYQRLAFIRSYLPSIFTPTGSLAYKAAPGNADGKEWRRFSHAHVVEQMLCADETIVDGMEILRKWMGLGPRDVEDFADERMQHIASLCSKLLLYFVTHLRDSDQPLSEQRLAQVVQRLRVVLAHADSDRVQVPVTQATIFCALITGSGAATPSTLMCADQRYLRVSHQMLSEPARRDEAGQLVQVQHAVLIELFALILETQHPAAMDAMLSLMDHTGVTTAGDGNYGVDNDEAYSLDVLKQQLDRRRPVDKYEFSAASCMCNRSSLASDIGQLVSFIERLFYRPTAAIAQQALQNTTEILALREREHYCPATFDLPVAWYRSSNGATDVHVRTRLPLFENVITDEKDAPSSLHFFIMSMANAPINPKLFGRFNGAPMEEHDGKDAGLHFRTQPDRVPRIGALRQPKPLARQPAPRPPSPQQRPASPLPLYLQPGAAEVKAEVKNPDPAPVPQTPQDPVLADPRLRFGLQQHQQQQQQQQQQQDRQQEEQIGNDAMEQDDFANDAEDNTPAAAAATHAAPVQHAAEESQSAAPMEIKDPAPEEEPLEQATRAADDSDAEHSDGDLHWKRTDNTEPETADGKGDSKREDGEVSRPERRKSRSRSPSRPPPRRRSPSKKCSATMRTRSKSRAKSSGRSRSRSKSPRPANRHNDSSSSNRKPKYGTQQLYVQMQKKYQTSKDETRRRRESREQAARERERERSRERQERASRVEAERRREAREREDDIEAERTAARERREQLAAKKKSDTALMDTEEILNSVPATYQPLASRKKPAKE